MVRFLDTNAVLNTDLTKEAKIMLSSVTLEELEGIKTNRNKTDEIRYKARKAIHWLDKNPDKWGCIVYSDEYEKRLVESEITNITQDNKIIACCAYTNFNDDVTFVTDDICCKVIARDIFNLNVESIRDQFGSIYKGYRVITGDTELINSVLSSVEDWTINEYAIIHNTDDNSESEMRFDGEKFVNLKLPSSKYIKGKNALQRCALDILNNPDITIAAILGGFGSGKSYITSKMALYSVQEKGWQAKVLGVREVLGEGKEIGYLPGEKESKIGDFFLPLAQQLDGGEYELDLLKQRGVLEVNTPYFMKGTTYNETVMLVDEAEDLNEKQVRLIGTRIGQNSRIFFNGDYRQSVINTSISNALVKMCNEFKGNPMFACIYLGEDVRSTTSKLFAGLFNE